MRQRDKQRVRETDTDKDSTAGRGRYSEGEIQMCSGRYDKERPHDDK